MCMQFNIGFCLLASILFKDFARIYKHEATIFIESAR